MARVDPDKDALKQALKEAFTETLHEQRELLHEVLAEVVEDAAWPKPSAKADGPISRSAARYSMFWRTGRKTVR